MPGTKRSPTTAHRTPTRSARRPTKLAAVAVPTVAPSVTKTPSSGPNSNPLPAARIEPGTNNAPANAETTT